TYKSSLGQPVLANLSVKRNGASLILTFEGGRVTGRLTIPKTDNLTALDLPIDRQLPEGSLMTLQTLAPATYALLLSETEQHKPTPAIVHQLLRLLDNVPTFQTVAVAPVRTKPRRTYDPVSDDFRPEGDHIPLILARALSPTSSSKERDQLKDALVKFGDASGLFTEVRVKNLGKSPSDPFQILVAVAGRPFNLSDVGYGVSQSLPVLVESALAGRRRLLLLQQPEVHLHPRAQAALGSFFVQLAATQQKQFVIETHSDYLIDRVRQEIAKGTIDPGLVQLIFFERSHSESKIYPLSLDRHGNILETPISYRDFFLREEEALLRRAQTQQ
ncbi:MAG: AAA family ATPase, partial [Terriglobia bacterium]